MYKTARKEAGLSLEEASFRLHISRKTLVNYENGDSPIPSDIVYRMAIIYGKPELLVNHCAKNCPIGQLITQELRKRDMATSVLGLLKELDDVNRLKTQLIEIASDGELDDSEIPDFKKFLKEIRELKQTIGEVEQFAMRRIGLEIALEKEKPATQERVPIRSTYA